MAIALVTLIIYLLNNVQGFLYYSLFGKLEMLNNAYVYGENNSALSRWESVIVPLEFLVRSPILGIGEEGLEEMTNVIGHNMFTCTIVNYFAYYGFLCGVVCINGFIKLMDLRRKSFIETFFLISIMIMEPNWQLSTIS